MQMFGLLNKVLIPTITHSSVIKTPCLPSSVVFPYFHPYTKAKTKGQDSYLVVVVCIENANILSSCPVLDI